MKPNMLKVHVKKKEIYFKVFSQTFKWFWRFKKNIIEVIRLQ